MENNIDMKHKRNSKRLNVFGGKKEIISNKTISVIAVMASIIAAYYGYKTYKESQPPQLCIEIRNLKEYRDVSGYTFFYNLMIPLNGTAIIPYNGYKYLIGLGANTANEYHAMGIPYIVNRSNKSMKKFSMEIRVSYCRLNIPLREIRTEDYEIVENDTISETLLLKYKHDILYPNSAIPIPIRFMYLPESEYEEDKYSWIFFDYKIAYDGIPCPINFVSNYRVYFDNENPWGISEQHLDEFITQCYREGCFTDNSILVSIIDPANDKIDFVTPPRWLNDTKFEKYKKYFIENRKQSTPIREQQLQDTLDMKRYIIIGVF